jgi:hypothetical protein
MKKLIVLTALGMLTVSATGCRLCDRLFRGSPAQTAIMAPGTVCCPADPCVDACGASVAPCAPAAVLAPGTPYLTPGPVP